MPSLDTGFAMVLGGRGGDRGDGADARHHDGDTAAAQLMGPARDSHRPDISRGSARAHVHAYFPVYAGLFRARFRAVGTIAPCAAPPKTGTGPHKARITDISGITDITGLCPFMC